MTEFIENFQRPSLLEVKQNGQVLRLPDFDTLVRILYRDRSDIYALLKMVEDSGVGGVPGVGVLGGVERLNQGAAIASTLLYTPTATGRFAVRGYAVCSTAGAGTVSFLLTWTDEIKAQQENFIGDLGLAALGNQNSGQKILRAIAGQPIRFSTTVVGMGGGSRYDLSVGLEAA